MTESVLVVEDNRDLAENVADMLREEGVDVRVCFDSAGAEQLASEHGFDLALVDIRLAGMDVGLDLVPKLRRLSVHGEILLMTGNATLDSAIQAIRRGVYAYVTKPFEPENLITLVKRALAQVALKRDKQALSNRLAASEALYRSVVESVESCIVGLDRHGVICFCNRFAAERFGVAQGQLLGRYLPSLAIEAEQSVAESMLQRALSGSPVRDAEFSIEREGGARRVRWTLTPLTPMHLPALSLGFDEAEGPLAPRLLAAGIDITDRLELERKSAQGEAMAAMGTLTTALAHEIRNPLNAAKLQLELLARRAKRLSDPHVQEALEEPVQLVRSEINRLASLLDEFLDLARPRQIELRPVSAETLFDQVHKLQRPLLDGSHVRLNVRIEPQDLTLKVDADRIKQVLINLIANAVDALRGTDDPHIELSATRAEGRIILSVTDNGPGIPAEFAGSAFTPFVTSKPSGTGLGLSIVQKIARQHGGLAELIPLTRGTQARVEIPD